MFGIQAILFSVCFILFVGFVSFMILEAAFGDDIRDIIAKNKRKKEAEADKYTVTCPVCGEEGEYSKKHAILKISEVTKLKNGKAECSCPRCGASLVSKVMAVPEIAAAFRRRTDTEELKKRAQEYNKALAELTGTEDPCYISSTEFEAVSEDPQPVRRPRLQTKSKRKG